MRPPRFVVIITIVVILGLGLVSLGTWQVVDIKNDVRDQNCKRAVSVRDDNRAMWLYLLSTVPETPRTRNFVKVLNEKLPPVDCIDGLIVEED